MRKWWQGGRPPGKWPAFSVHHHRSLYSTLVSTLTKLGLGYSEERPSVSCKQGWLADVNRRSRVCKVHSSLVCVSDC